MMNIARFVSLIALCILPASAAKKTEKPIVAIYDIDEMVTESGQLESSMLDFDVNATRPLTLFDITRSMAAASTDPQVRALVLDVDGAGLDFAQIQEIRRRLMDARKAGKDVWIYTESLSNGTALLGSAANHFTLMPEADCSFHGIHAESMYFKGMLDKAGIQAEVIHIGDFKSFGEMFYRNGPSDAAKQQEQQLVDDIYQQLTSDVAIGRRLKTEDIINIIDDGSPTPLDMSTNGMVDQLLHRTDFVAKVRETYGKDADYDSSYQLPELDGPQITGMMDVFKLMFDEGGSAKSKADYVAVVALDGDITDQSIAPVRSQILKLSKDPKAKALVLRVNSPGGSALASEVLWEATDEWKAKDRPFVVSMGGVAASGGYYVSAGADRIFAEAGTITGSIGVVGMKFVVGGAMEKLGITSHTIQRGKNAGTMSMTRPFTPEETELVRNSMEQVYATFKQRVTSGRGDAIKGDLESLAGGRVYSGQQALEVGLVDEIGGLQEAINFAAASASLYDPETRLLPEPKSGIEGLFTKPKKKDDEMIQATPARASGSINVVNLLQAMGLTHALPAPTRAAVSRLIKRLESFRETQVLLLGPDLQLR